jgi:hypothetical protein
MKIGIRYLTAVGEPNASTITIVWPLPSSVLREQAVQVVRLLQLARREPARVVRVSGIRAGREGRSADPAGVEAVQQDADAFSQIYGLPAVDLTIARAPGVWHNSSPHLGAAGWSGVTTLDVEWAHATAPGAKIVLVPGPMNTGSLDEAINDAVVHHLGNVISNSWSNFEGLANPATFDRDQRILEQAAAEGIDVNFSSGDWGDNTPLFGIKAPSFPADSPYATSVGRTSLALNADNTIAWQTGWGTSLTRLATQKDGSPWNPTGTSNGTTFTADELANVPGYGLPPTYFAALHHSPYSGSWSDIDFGVATSLLTGAGRDDVTGLGSPNDATAFVNAVAAAGA